MNIVSLLTQDVNAAAAPPHDYGRPSPLQLANHLPPHETPITERELDCLFVHLLRLPVLLADARQMLAPHLFDAASEAHFALLWAVACELVDEYHTFTCLMLTYTCKRELASGRYRLTDSMRDRLLRSDPDGIIWRCMRTPIEELNLDFGRAILRRFLRERMLIRPMQFVLSQGGGCSNVSSFSDMIEAAFVINRQIESLRSIPLDVAVPDISSRCERNQ